MLWSVMQNNDESNLKINLEKEISALSMTDGNDNPLSLASHRVEALRALYRRLKPKEEEKKEPPRTWPKKIKFFLVVLLGIIVIACEGFDGIASLLSVFAFSTLTISIAGLAFALLTVGVFCLMELGNIASDLGVSFSQSKPLLDCYLEQVEIIKKIRVVLDSISFDKTIPIKQKLAIIDALIKVNTELEAPRKKMQENRQILLGIAKAIATLIAGVLSFAGGFFTGQAVATTVAAFFFPTATVLFWPVLIAGAAVGLTALVFYWAVERPALQAMISRWAGRDPEKVEKFCNKIESGGSKLLKVKKNLNEFQNVTTSPMSGVRGEESMNNSEIVPVPEKNFVLLFPKKQLECQFGSLNVSNN